MNVDKRCMDRKMEGWMIGRKEVCMENALKEGRMGGQIDNGWMDKQMDES